MRRITLVLALMASLLTSACAETKLDQSNKYTVSAAAVSAGIGATIGAGLGDPGAGALIGGLVGATAGLLYSEYWKEEIDEAFGAAVEEDLDLNF